MPKNVGLLVFGLKRVLENSRRLADGLCFLNAIRFPHAVGGSCKILNKQHYALHKCGTTLLAQSRLKIISVDTIKKVSIR